MSMIFFTERFPPDICALLIWGTDMLTTWESCHQPLAFFVEERTQDYCY